MSGDFFIAAMAITHGILIVALILFLINDKRKYGSAFGYSATMVLSDFAEQQSHDLPGKNMETALTELKKPPLEEAELDYNSKVGMALQRLGKGDDPQIIAREFDFSDAEMGILKATSGKAADKAPLHN
jgi:hypothetical protein